MMANDELIAGLHVTSRAFFKAGYPTPAKTLKKAAQALAAQDARIAELEAKVQSLEDAYRYDCD